MRHTPTNNNSITRLLAWTVLPVIGLILFGNVAAFLSSPTSSEITCGFACVSKVLLDYKMKLYSKYVEQRRQADEEEKEVKTNLSTTMGSSSRNRHSAKHPLPSQSTAMKIPFTLPDSYNGRNSLFLFSSSEPIPSYFSLDLSTQENYGVENKNFYGPFKDIRSELDFNYHGNYSKSRQEFQDKIVERLLDGTIIHDSKNGRVCKTPTEPWIVFTAGVMGAGKSHTMKDLASKGLFPLGSFIVVDPDEIRSHFPEYHLYANQCPKRAGELTHKEAGYLTEIVTEAAMQRGYNVLVDGSLKDSGWYGEYFGFLRDRYKNIRIAILHITAPRDAVLKRAAHRAKETGRVVPIETLEMSLKQVPISVKELAPMVDFFSELDNSPTSVEVKLKTEGVTWDSFRDNWSQTCSLDPGQNAKKRF